MVYVRVVVHVAGVSWGWHVALWTRVLLEGGIVEVIVLSFYLLELSWILHRSLLWRWYLIKKMSRHGKPRRCTCHGHGEYCTTSACECEHNTAGKNCERCLDMFNDLPWQEATAENPFVCKGRS